MYAGTTGRIDTSTACSPKDEYREEGMAFCASLLPAEHKGRRSPAYFKLYNEVMLVIRNGVTR